MRQGETTCNRGSDKMAKLKPKTKQLLSKHGKKKDYGLTRLILLNMQTSYEDGERMDNMDDFREAICDATGIHYRQIKQCKVIDTNFVELIFQRQHLERIEQALTLLKEEYGGKFANIFWKTENSWHMSLLTY
eukprot:NODE_449_length_7289_cov_1.146453.p3 type:complete len:133 gc:universal NODE_449_length_7289_cov_1.146453:2702-3100(+)